MQPIQDKDFDKLFKDTFEDAEVAPSRDLWSSIESKFESKKKRIIPVYWLSAAAVLLIATVAVLIYQQQNTLNTGKKLVNNTIEKTAPIADAQPIKDSSSTAVASIEKIENKLPISSKPISTLAKSGVKKVTKTTENYQVTTAPEMQKQETIIALVEEPKQDINAKIEEVILHSKEETVLAANLGSAKNEEIIGENNEFENKGFRNVGDVINLIVNKVDKRKDKFIQFRTDDDDSSISSINIGPFRFGKKNNK